MRTKGIGPHGLGISKTSPLKQTKEKEGVFSEKSRDLSSETKPRKKTNRELYREAMRAQNDSLRKLPKTDKHHLPTFDARTEEGYQAQKDFYTFSPKNQKLRDLRKLGDNLRKKYGI